jgi:ribosome assembly protein YihI (activator of Der GTPase)
VREAKKVETKEATGVGSSGSYETTGAWAKSTKKKDWRGASKTQIPGGKFVQVKKKCKKFPYCNQGDINALNIWENETLKKVIYNVSQKYNISENVVKNIIAY